MILLVFLFGQKSVYAQSGIWTSVSNIPQELENKQMLPREFKVFSLDVAGAKASLSKAPQETLEAAQSIPALLEVPMPNGSTETFAIVESSIMQAGLALKYPEIKTYAGYSLKDRSITGRFDITPKGFHAIILYSGGAYFVEPVSQASNQYYLVFDQKDAVLGDTFTASNFQINQVIESPKADKQTNGNANNSPPLANATIGDGALRIYGLAVAATGEYTAFHGGTVADALAAQVTTINRVNAIFIRDLAVKLILITNNDTIIYTDAATDPYLNPISNVDADRNQANLDREIGRLYYDIGHLFAVGTTYDVASIGVACFNGYKAKGVSASTTPIGAAYDIIWVAHTLAHQLGAKHTFNNNCSGSRDAATAFEPGGGSTLMSRGNLCPPNPSNNFSPYFHSSSIENIQNFIVSGIGQSCVYKPAYTNAKPVISSSTGNQTIPKGTPFLLTASATDTDANDILTYNWEQRDNQISTQPPASTSTNGPSFRNFEPTTNGTRYFPRLEDLVANVSPTWEVLPTVGRTLNFWVLVRDNKYTGGTNDKAAVTLTVDGSSGPFIVNIPSVSGITWAGLSTQTVTWAVANTNIAPVSCTNVDILLSLDGGMTYPITLASNVSNSGSANVTIPNISTSTARIMVKGTDRAFFDISNNNFTIACPSASVTPPTSLAMSQNAFCNDASVTLTATCASGTVTWYNQETLGTALGTGSGFVHSPTSPTTYYAGCEIGSCSSPRVYGGKIESITTPVVYNGTQGICVNTSVTLSAYCSSSTVKWYNAGGTTLLYTGANFVTPSIDANTTYKVRCENGTCTSTFTDVVLSVNPQLAPPVTNENVNYCIGSSVTLNADCAAGTVTWYSPDAIPLGVIGSSLVAPNIVSTINYKVRCEQNGCVSAFVNIVITIRSKPIAPAFIENTPSASCSLTLNPVIVNNYLSFENQYTQYLKVPHSASINLGSTATIEAWVNYSSLSLTIIDKGDKDFLWAINPNNSTDGKMGFYNKATSTWVYSTTAVPFGIWTHVAITLSGGTLTFYINGLASGTASGITFSQDTGDMNIGREQPSSCKCNFYQGAMDEVRLWNVARTQADIQSNMNGSVAVNSTGLVAYYKFNEGTGTTATDATANNNHATLMNGPTWQVSTLSWSPGGATTPSLVATTDGTYTLTLTNAYGCTNASSTQVFLKPFIPAFTSAPSTTVCSTTIAATSAIGHNYLSFIKANSQYLRVPHSSSINIGTTLTLEAWVNYSGINSTIIDKGNYDFLWQLNANAHLLGNTGKMGFYHGATNQWIYSTGIVPQNTWTHVAITINGRSLTFYINGVSAGLTIFGSNLIAQDNAEMNIGRQQPTYCQCNHFNGSMDELRVWNIVRTQSQIQANMSTSIPTNSSGLVAYYKFEETSGSTTNDATANGNHATFMNGPTRQAVSYTWSPGGGTGQSFVASTEGTYTASITNAAGCITTATTEVVLPKSPAPIITASGPLTFCSGGSVTLNANTPNNSALVFTKASNQYLTVPHSASINLGATFTIEAWVNYSGENSTIVDKGDYDFLFQLNANGFDHRMGVYQKSSSQWFYSTAPVPENTWAHVAITLSGGTLTFYINGVASGTATVGFLQDNGEMNIGRQQPSACQCNHFNGTMDELRIWNIARTQAEIQADRNATIAANSSGLVAYYKFDEGTGTTTADATPNNNHATFVNGPVWQVPSASPVNAVVWSPGGATTKSITVTNAGNYTASITNGLGCVNSTTTTVAISSGATLETLTSPTDDYSSGTVVKTASSSNGKIQATNKVTGTANVSYKAKNMELNPGFRADNGTTFLAEIGGCN